MQQRVIGFDIDGVITDEMLPDGTNVWYSELESYFGGIRQIKRSFLFTEAYGLDEESVIRFMQERAEDIFRRVPVRRGAKAVLSRLADLGFKVHLITARDCQYRDVTKEWLTRNSIPYHQLWLAKDKVTLCKQLGVQLFVDDHWDNCQALMAASIPVVMMNMPHNELLQVPVPRVSTWSEIWDWCVRLFGLDETEATA